MMVKDNTAAVEYCVNGLMDCECCSLVNYGFDCRNVKIEDNPVMLAKDRHTD